MRFSIFGYSLNYPLPTSDKTGPMHPSDMRICHYYPQKKFLLYMSGTVDHTWINQTLRKTCVHFSLCIREEPGKMSPSNRLLLEWLILQAHLWRPLSKACSSDLRQINFPGAAPGSHSFQGPGRILQLFPLGHFHMSICHPVGWLRKLVVQNNLLALPEKYTQIISHFPSFTQEKGFNSALGIG